MTIDISKIKPGDKVTLVPLEVVNVCSQPSDVLNPIQVEVPDRHAQHRIFWVGPDQIAAHHPAPREIGVGDRVRIISWRSRFIGTVRGVDESEVWVKWDEATCNPQPIWPASDLTLVEGDQ